MDCEDSPTGRSSRWRITGRSVRAVPSGILADDLDCGRSASGMPLTLRNGPAATAALVLDPASS